jgi:hypothetical protein
MEKTEIEMLRMAVNVMAIKAIIATHPNPEKLKDAFDQLLVQFQTKPGVMGNPEYAAFIRQMAGDLFAPTALIDTGIPGAAT